jgi:transposase
LRLGVHDLLDDTEQVEVQRARRSIRVTVTTSPGPACRHPLNLAAVAARARHLLAVDVSVGA